MERSTPLPAPLAIVSLMFTPDQCNQLGAEYLQGHLGMVITHLSASEVRSELPVRKSLMAPNGFLNAGSVTTIADTSAGFGCFANLPEGATGFTTVELKCNYVGTARDGTVECTATPVHLGRTTQVWDAVVKHRESGKTIALFRCTQLIFYANQGS